MERGEGRRGKSAAGLARDEAVVKERRVGRRGGVCRAEVGRDESKGLGNLPLPFARAAAHEHDDADETTVARVNSRTQSLRRGRARGCKRLSRAIPRTDIVMSYGVVVSPVAEVAGDGWAKAEI